MSERTGHAIDWAPRADEARFRQQFIEAWQDALRDGGDPPRIDVILVEIEAPPSAEFRRDLESLDALFRLRLSRGVPRPLDGDDGATVQLPHEPTVDRAEAARAEDTMALEPESPGQASAPITQISQPPADAAAAGGPRASAAAAPLTAATDDGQGDDLSAPRDPNAETRAYLGDDTPVMRDKRGMPLALPRAVAGYEIEGVLGRGGMGVVYKARQPGLKRMVALKMILAGGHASAEDLARFRSEAEAVAHLQHPNIVQIYEIGEDEGRPYFSLEFVEGMSLAHKLEGKPQTPRQAAEIMLVLARAMAAAHQRGIVHRDLKPANVLVARDGTLKITDFGLAKRLEDEAGAQTHSGAILGTPDYMSPEQAAGRSRQIGPAADIYALGAMLYEMLAGRVPLRGASVLDTLQQVVAKEPVAPTQLDPKVPRDLETICLKCLRKDPAKRYLRVDELAEDLRRFLAGEPILARPISRAERAYRWCKRNPRVTALSAAVALLVLAWGASASAVALLFKQKSIEIAAALDSAEKGWNKAEINLGIAEENEKKAERNAQEADRNADEARQNALVAERQAEQAKANAETAKDQHRKAVDLLVDLGKHLEQRLQGRRSLLEKPELRTLQSELLEMVRSAMTSMAQEIESSNITSFGMANTCFSLGELLFRFGRGEEAMRQYQYGYKLVKQVVDSQPDNDLARANLAMLLMQIGKMELELNDDARQARQHFVEAHQLQQAIADKPQNNANFTAIDHHRLLSFYDFQTGIADLHLGQPAEAKKNFEAALGHREAWVLAEPNNIAARSYLSQVHYWLGVTGWHLNDLDATQDHFRKALGVCHELADAHPVDFSFRLDLAEIYGDYSDAKLRLGKPDDAWAAAGRSLEFLQAVLAHDPDFVSRQALLALTYERQALICLKRDEPSEAARLFGEARTIRDDLEQVDPQNRAWKMASARTLAHCGEHAAAAQKAQELIDQAPDNVGMLLQAAQVWSVCSSAAAGGKQADYRRRAIEALRKATAGDFRDAVVLETDPELALIQDDAGYLAMLNEIRAR